MNSRCHSSSTRARVARQRLQLEIEKLVDVERARLVLLVELLVARFVHLAVEHALLDQELRPLEVAVAGEQGVVEIEQGEPHEFQRITARTKGRKRGLAIMILRPLDRR